MSHTVVRAIDELMLEHERLYKLPEPSADDW